MKNFIEAAAKVLVYIAGGILLSVFYLRAKGLGEVANDLRDGALALLLLSVVLGVGTRLLTQRSVSSEKISG